MPTTAWLTCLLSLASCEDAERPQAEKFQGVAELEERILAFEIGGRVDVVKVKEGQRVPKGALLASIDESLTEQAGVARELEAKAASAQAELVKKGARPEQIATLRARVRAAEATEALLKKQTERERTLVARNVTPLAGLEDLEGQLARATAERQALQASLRDLERGARTEEREAAEAHAEAAHATVTLDELRLRRRELYTPIEAWVLDVHADVGEVVTPAQPVITVAEPDHVFAEVFVPQGQLSGIDVGDHARVQADELPGPLEGTVEHIARRTEFTPRYLFSERERANLVVRVKVRIHDAEHQLHAGVPVFVSIDRDSQGPVASTTSHEARGTR